MELNNGHCKERSDKACLPDRRAISVDCFALLAMTARDKFQKLKSILSSYRSVVAFSGGCDSALVSP